MRRRPQTTKRIGVANAKKGVHNISQLGLKKDSSMLTSVHQEGGGITCNEAALHKTGLNMLESQKLKETKGDF